MNFVTAALTDRHGRANNEDCHCYFQTPALSCWVVADGLGGHLGGDLASRLAAEEIIASCAALGEFSPRALSRHLEAAQQALIARQQADPPYTEMRTTAVVLLAAKDQALWAHLGDSRLYHFRNGRLVFQTRDHSVSQALVNAGELKAEEIRTHEDRHRLLRALGEEGRFQPALKEEPQPLEPGDAFLLCTDGFWQYVLEAEMEEALSRSDTPGVWLDRLAEVLRRRARESSQTPDNYTALAVFLE